jgi:uncharacterized lipoprotein YddW (UPF0748 family)
MMKSLPAWVPFSEWNPHPDARRRRLGSWLATLLLAGNAAAQGWSGLVDGFAYATSDAARLSWTAGANTPPAQVAASDGGLRLPCVFAGETARVYWDRAVTLNLAGRSALELDLTCPHPEAIQSLLVYAKSGDGWYVWRVRLDQAGRRKHLLPLHQASTEGRPKGWSQVSAIRVSASRGSGASTHLVLHSLQALSCQLVVLQSPAPSAGTEAMAARNAALRVSRWLTDLAIPHLLVTEDQASASLGAATLAILPYSPAPAAPVLADLDRLVRRRGKLMVCYSSSEELAALMGVTLGDYQRSAIPGHWGSFTFLDPTPGGAPRTVFQESSNIRPVKPAGKTSRILAYWNDEKGRRLDDPAWVQTDRGLWMTHILLDGDDENKKRMLAALLALYEPSIWPTAAEHYRAAATRVGPFSNLAAAQAGIREIARINGRGGRVSEPLDQAAKAAADMTQRLAQGDYPGAVEQAVTARRRLTEAYALAQAPAADEFRGVWCHAGLGLYPGDWDRTAALVADSGFHAIFPNLLWAGSAHYPSRVIPASDLARLYGDQLEACSKAARARGLQLHVWKVCWKLGRAPADFTAKLRAEGRFQVNDKLQPLEDWLCPSHPDNAALELAAVVEALTRTPVDGIHLDYIRFPDGRSCFCRTCRRRFEAHLGKRVAAWPADVVTGPQAAAWRTWRQGVITDFVRSVRREARRINPRLKVSAAVFSTYPECASSVGQNWGAWLQEGLVDFVCPMTYQTDLTQFSGLTRRHLELPASSGRIYPGLGVTASESRLTPDQVIGQIAWLRANGAPGFLLFDLTRTLERDVLPILRMGMTER